MPRSSLPRSLRQSCATGLPGATGVRRTRAMLPFRDGFPFHLGLPIDQSVEFHEGGRRETNFDGLVRLDALCLAPQPAKALEPALLHLVLQPLEGTDEPADVARPVRARERVPDAIVGFADQLFAGDAP